MISGIGKCCCKAYGDGDEGRRALFSGGERSLDGGRGEIERLGSFSGGASFSALSLLPGSDLLRPNDLGSRLGFFLAELTREIESLGPIPSSTGRCCILLLGRCVTWDGRTRPGARDEPGAMTSSIGPCCDRGALGTSGSVGGWVSTMDMMDCLGCDERERVDMEDARLPALGTDLAVLERVRVLVVETVVCAPSIAEAGRGRGFGVEASRGVECAAADTGRARGVAPPDARFRDADDCDRFTGTFPTSAAFQPAKLVEPVPLSVLDTLTRLPTSSSELESERTRLPYCGAGRGSLPHVLPDVERP